MNRNYSSIAAHSKNCQRISNTILDDFLLYYAAIQKKLHVRMERNFKKYKHITRILDETLVGAFKAQYIAHTIFKEKGMIHTLLRHSKVRERDPEEYEYLQLMSQKPWRFCFSRITDQPADHFFNMVDVFSGEEFLLYSKGTQTLSEKENPLLYLNLIGYNGRCWETFGPLIYFKGFVPDDIFFFASELNPEIENEQDVIATIQRDPLPFMMLISGANYPVSFTRSYELVFNSGEFVIEHFQLDPSKFKKYFDIEKKENIYKLELKGWYGMPHFSKVYYDEKNELLYLISMTDDGYEALVKHLNDLGIIVPVRSTTRVHPAMIALTKQIIKKEFVLEPYSDLFDEPVDPAEKKEMDILNKMLEDIGPHLNAGTEPDVKSIALKYGQDPEMVRDLIRQIKR